MTILKKINPLFRYGFDRIGVKTVNNAAPDANGNVNVEAGGTSQIVTWAIGEPEPTVTADKKIGFFIEGKTHLVTTVTVETETIAVIQPENELIDIYKNTLIKETDAQPFKLTELTDYLVIAGDRLFGIISKKTGVFTQFPDYPSSSEYSVYDLHIDTIDEDGFIYYSITYVGTSNVGFFLKRSFFYTENVLGEENLFDVQFWDDPDFSAIIENQPACLIIDSSQKILVGFEQGNVIEKFNVDGSTDTGFLLDATITNASCWAICENPNGGYFIGTSSNVGSLHAIDANGAINANFTKPASITENVPMIKIYGNKLFVSTTQPALTPQLFKMDYFGTIDETFFPDFSDFHFWGSFYFQGSKIIVLGSQDLINGTSSLKRLNENGTVDETFVQDVNLDVWSFHFYGSCVDSDNNIFCTYTGDVTGNFISKLMPDGSLFYTEKSFIQQVIDRIDKINNRVHALENPA
jgi:hypothetical protein